MELPAFWNTFAGRELDCTPLEDRARARIVACLNVWNDLDALRASVPTWRSYVDHVIVVDGAYDTIGQELSTDGTRAFLQATFKSIQIIDAPGLSQAEKRSKYLAAARPGDYCVILDADEHVTDGVLLRDMPTCDVGWIRIRSPLYKREYGQPRVIRWRPNLRYSGRHHWIYEGDRLLCTHQYGGAGYAHRPLSICFTNNRTLGRDHMRLAAKRQHLSSQLNTEAPLVATPRSSMSDVKLGAREALWILNYAYRDDGLAPSRFHTAINRTTPHSSVFFKSRPGPFGVPTQYDARTHMSFLQSAIRSADVAHVHTVVSMSTQVTRPIPHVFHHHGSLLRANAPEYLQAARRKGALVLVSNLELLSWTDGYPAFFLPNTMPVARYWKLAHRATRPYEEGEAFRVSHSPTHAHRKGTVDFIAACDSLRAKGYPIEPVLIEHKTHRDTLALKATCHAAFDSFWLGMQCSGLESAAMGIPVIAGDPTVRDRYMQYFGSCPYTFANDRESLECELLALCTNADYRATEASRVHEYVVANHDESAVALLYLDYLDTAFDWRNAKRRNGSLHPQSLVRQEAASHVR